MPVLCNHQWNCGWSNTYRTGPAAGTMMTEFWSHILVRPALAVHGLFPHAMQRRHLYQYHDHRHVCLMPPNCLLLALVDQYTWLMGRHCWVRISSSCANVETANRFKWDVVLFIINQHPCNCSHHFSINEQVFLLWYQKTLNSKNKTKSTGPSLVNTLPLWWLVLKTDYTWEYMHVFIFKHHWN